MTSPETALTSADQIAIAAAVIAFFAFVTSIWQAKLAREHNRRSVIPVLEIYVTQVDELNSIEFVNHGLGPARIKTVHVTIDGVTTQLGSDSTLEKLIHYVDGTLEPTVYYKSTIDDHTYIAPSQSRMLIKIVPKPEANTQSISKSIMNSLRQLNIVVDYESVYGENFVAKWDGDQVFDSK